MTEIMFCGTPKRASTVQRKVRLTESYALVKSIKHMFGVLGPRCWTGSSMLVSYVLKGFGIYMIGILGSLY